MLTLNESAQMVANILRDIQEKSPGSIDLCRAKGAAAYIEEACAELGVSASDLHEHHLIWLTANLKDDRSLYTLERTPAVLRMVGTEALVEVGKENIPWYD